MANEWDIEDWITEVASLPVKRFYPTAVAKDTQLPLDQVFEYLLDAVKKNKLKLLWEIRCPNLECVRTLQISPDKITTGEYSCPTCGENISISPDIVFPVFEVTPAYKTRIKEKKNQQPRIIFAMSRT